MATTHFDRIATKFIQTTSPSPLPDELAIRSAGNTLTQTFGAAASS